METLNLADLNTFFQDYAPTLVGKQPTFVSIDGGESAYVSFCIDADFVARHFEPIDH